MPVKINLEHEIAEGVRRLRSGGVMVAPTDTLYALSADALNQEAVDRVFSIKGRPSKMALPLLVSSWEQAQRVIREAPKLGEILAQRFWPGPLTLVLLRSTSLPAQLTGGLDTVAVRMPDHPAPLALAEGLGGPMTGTSANPSGGPNPKSLEEVESLVGQKVDYIIRSGPQPKGVGSTVVDISSGKPRLLREGALPFEKILVACG